MEFSISAGITSNYKRSLLVYSFGFTGESDFTLCSELEDSPSSSSEEDSRLSSEEPGELDSSWFSSSAFYS